MFDIDKVMEVLHGTEMVYGHLTGVGDYEICTTRELAEALTAKPCDGCIHIGKYENEIEYGYPSPCTRCKRRTCDNYATE